MGRAEPSGAAMGSLPLLLPLLPLLAALGALGDPGGLLAFPPLTGVHHNISEESCHLNVWWTPLQRMNGSSCPRYASELIVGGTSVDGCFDSDPSRRQLVPLGQTAVFRVRAYCNNTTGEWVNITLSPRDTGVTNARCVWQNMRIIVCEWQPGKNAEHGAFYSMSYWYNDLEKERPCTNYTKEGNIFKCSFEFLQGSKIQPLAISIRGKSTDIQPVCVLVREGIESVKLNPPRIVSISKIDPGVRLIWTPPLSFEGICYEVDLKDTKTKMYEDSTNVTFPTKGNELLTFRVRAIMGIISSRCQQTEGMWSEWSNEVVWDGRDNPFNILLLSLIPLCVTIVTVVLFIYQKRIKGLIYPKIPDFNKVKIFLEEQSKEFEKHPTEKPNMEEFTEWLPILDTSPEETKTTNIAENGNLDFREQRIDIPDTSGQSLQDKKTYITVAT